MDTNGRSILVPLHEAKLGLVLGVLEDSPRERALVLDIDVGRLLELGLELVDTVLLSDFVEQSSKTYGLGLDAGDDRANHCDRWGGGDWWSVLSAGVVFINNVDTCGIAGVALTGI